MAKGFKVGGVEIPGFDWGEDDLYDYDMPSSKSQNGVLSSAKDLAIIVAAGITVLFLLGYAIYYFFDIFWTRIYVGACALLVLYLFILGMQYLQQSMNNQAYDRILKAQKNTVGLMQAEYQPIVAMMAMMATLIGTMKPQVKANATGYEVDEKLRYEAEKRSLDLSFLAQKQQMQLEQRERMRPSDPADEWFGEEEFESGDGFGYPADYPSEWNGGPQSYEPPRQPPRQQHRGQGQPPPQGRRTMR